MAIEEIQRILYTNSMHIHYPHSLRKNIKLLTLSVLSMAMSFSVGMHTAGNVQPVTLIEAGGMEKPGDMDGNGIVNVSDAIVALEIVRGYRTAGAVELAADPNRDGEITVDDALRILSTISLE